MAGQKTKTKQMAGKKPILTLRVKGPGVRSGRISIPDLIQICSEAQNSLNRQAEAVEGFKTMHPGPVKNVIRKGCTLDLVRIGKGSTTLSFVPAESQQPLAFPGQTTFASDVIERLAVTIRDIGNGKGKGLEIDEGVLQGIYGLGGIAEGRRITEIEWISPKTGSHKRVAAKVNKVVRERVAARLSSPRKQTAQIDGMLDMADFKPNELRCRIDPAVGAPVPCTFEERDASQVQSLLREPVRVIGEGTFQPYTQRLESLHIRTIDRLPSLSLGEGNYYSETSFADLAAKQKIKPTKNASDLSGGFPSDENIDQFLEEIYKARK
jgi:hypothetical protein